MEVWCVFKFSKTFATRLGFRLGSERAKFTTSVGGSVKLLKRLGVLTGKGANLRVMPGKAEFKARLYFAHVHNKTFKKSDHKFVKGSKGWKSSGEFEKAKKLAAKHLDPCFVYVYGLAKLVLDDSVKTAKLALNSYHFGIQIKI
jgi:hypothetical protein